MLGGLGMAAAVGLTGTVGVSGARTPAPAAAGAAGTTVTLVSSRTTSRYDSWVTLSARVTASSGTPTGLVTFADASNGSILATEKLRNGRASFTTAALAPGQRRIVGQYRGGSTFA